MAQDNVRLKNIEKAAYEFVRLSIQGKNIKCPNSSCQSKNVKQNNYKIYCNEERRNYTLKHGLYIQNSKISYLAYIRFLSVYFIERKQLNYKIQSKYITINRRHLSKLFNKHRILMQEYILCPDMMSCKKTSKLITAINNHTKILKKIGILC